MRYTEVTADEFATLDGLDDWRVVLRTLHARFRATSFPAAAALISEIADAAEASVHHPDIELRYPGVVHVALTTHETGGLTDADVALARTISALAADAGAEPDPSATQQLEVAIDTVDADRIRPFWIAVLGYRERDGNLVDPHGSGPRFWFQDTEATRKERQRLHIDVNVAHDVAEQRVADTIAAGGRLVTDEFAPSWWVLADADGNEACISTWQHR